MACGLISSGTSRYRRSNREESREPFLFAFNRVSPADKLVSDLLGLSQLLSGSHLQARPLLILEVIKHGTEEAINFVQKVCGSGGR
jgi:hypothetical protein